MKTFRHLYSRVWSFENLLLAWRWTARGKRSRPDTLSPTTPARDQQPDQ